MQLIGVALWAWMASGSLAQDRLGSNAKLYDMTRNELLEESPKVLLREVQYLRSRAERDDAKLDALRQTNAKLCQRLQRLYNECAAMHHIDDAFGADQLGCTDNPSTKPNIAIRVHSEKGGSFRLIANEKYVSNELKADGEPTSVTFKRTDRRLVVPPRFRDLTMLNIVAIRSGGTVDERTRRPNDLSISITIDGRPLLDEYTLLKPEDEVDVSSYRINPRGILELRTKAECLVGLDEIHQLTGR